MGGGFSRSQGEIIGDRYRIIRSLASGGMGELYEVEHVAVGRRFALKLLRPDLILRGSSASRFDKEARAAA